MSYTGVRGRLCNPSYWDDGIWGWLENRSPPWRLLVPLGRPHLILELIPSPLGAQVGPGLGVVVIRSPFQTKFQFCWVPRIGGVKSQLLCGVRIELAVGSLPYPGMIRIPGSVLDETGNYLNSQFVSPVWTWGKIPLGIPTFLPMEGVYQTKPKV